MTAKVFSALSGRVLAHVELGASVASVLAGLHTDDAAAVLLGDSTTIQGDRACVWRAHRKTAPAPLSPRGEDGGLVFEGVEVRRCDDNTLVELPAGVFGQDGSVATSVLCARLGAALFFSGESGQPLGRSAWVGAGDLLYV